ncbi:MAG: hypothetical protein WBE79_04270 [Candidatus Cybelea sp.]
MMQICTHARSAHARTRFILSAPLRGAVGGRGTKIAQFAALLTPAVY